MADEPMNEAMMEDFEVAWSKNHFARMNDGGMWAVPRSGLIFQKRGARLVLTARMPHMDGMPLSAEQLREYQDADFKVIQSNFEAARIPVVSKVPSDG